MSDYYYFDQAALTTEANRVKDSVIDYLAKQGLLKESLEDIAPKVTVMYYKPSWLGKLWRKFTKKNADEFYHVVTHIEG